MQNREELLIKKKLIKEALAKTMRENRGRQSLFKFSSENDLPLSVVSEAERAQKDPQLTTIFKLAEAYSLPVDVFVRNIAAKLPPDFSMIDK